MPHFFLKFKSPLLAILFVLCALVTAIAQNSIKAEVDKRSISTDDTITYKLTITSTENKTEQPQLPSLEGFSVLSQAQSSTISFARSNIETLFVYVFVLAPKQAGKFKIEPSQIKFQGKTYSSDIFEIEVTQGKQKLEPEPEEKPSLPEGFQPQIEPQITL
jgi:hypothetical protein